MPNLGVVMGCWEGTGTTGTSIGDVKGYTFNIDPNVLQDVSIDGITLSQGGVVKTTLDIEVNRPVKTFLTGMLRTSSGTSVTTAKEFTVGSQTGRVYVVGCQPAGFTYGVTQDQIPHCTLRYWGLMATEVTTGTHVQPTQAGGVSDGWHNFVALLGTTTGTGVDYGVQSFEIALNTNPQWYTDISSVKTSAQKRIPTAVLLGAQDWTLTMDCTTKISHTVAKLTADDIVSDFSFTGDGGDIDFALASMPTPAEPWEIRGPNDLVVWRYQFKKPSHFAASIVA